ncbi:MAG: hypothetical protein COX36_01290 [Candidatus Nealsonbacteria bacterium CG23_combo_of_CG06-09_8_20_14_all_38_19]|uniref:Uncharacterized protein n=1 Tax=Candidatus Nealsonbacteria bacterium CG23_combo_of_CG06-09_8_20_14_all_38_19 TaxID=1974721 RepID=A0A2G9YX98_9BACT|nr:MAG: hypothetical protein COX36_01290 [Candidatus Nealsonbacteria bacterium CG23_combo_of_CG06-09_8_20_14_all_38_19]
MYLQDEVNKSMKEKNKRFCLFCGYELVLKDYGEPEMKDCYLSNEEFLEKNKKPGKCRRKHYCYGCKKFID